MSSGGRQCSAAIALAVLLGGCATHVPQALEAPMVPASFAGPIPPSQQVWPQPDWWQQFNSPELSQLILKAQSDNRDLAVAAARVMQAHAQTTIQRAALFPQIDLQAQGQRARISGIQSAAGTAGVVGNSFGLTLGASYQLDIWGLARSDLRAAEESFKSARFARQSVALTLTADVANAYFSILALRQRIGIAKEDIAAINDILSTINLRVATGTSSHLDLARERAQVESAEAQLVLLQEQELEARLTLSVLTGQTAQMLEVKSPGPQHLHLPVIAPGLPSELLLRRPDVAMAEANLAAAHANVDAARAAFLPQFALSGGDGFASAAIGALLHGPSVVWDFGGSMLQTVFDGGVLVGKKRLAQAVQQELVVSYQGAALNAYADVEAALGQVRNNMTAAEHLGREVDAAQEAFQISQLQYRQGTTDLLTVLQSQQTLFSAEDQLAQISLARLQAVVHLYEALGGGWVEAPEQRTQFWSAPVAAAVPAHEADRTSARPTPPVGPVRH